MNYEQACELYFQWAKIEAGDPDAEPMVPNRDISKDVGGTWYLANVCGPLATVCDTEDADCAVEHPITGDGKWNDITDAGTTWMTESQKESRITVEKYFWLAINGPSVAASSFPLPKTVSVSPTPRQLVGYKSQEEQRTAQQFLLSAPMAEVRKYLKKEIPRRIRKGDVLVIFPEKPEPPTRECTVWTTGNPSVL